MSEEVVKKIDRIKKNFVGVLSEFDNLSADNFDSTFASIQSKMNSAEALRHELIDEFGVERLQKVEGEVFSLAKQIQNKYDSVVNSFKKEQGKLLLQIQLGQNQKKIVQYQR